MLPRLQELRGITVTGSAAARRLLPGSAISVLPLRLLALYAADPARLAQELGLIPAEPSTGNLVIATPQDDRVLPMDWEPEVPVAPTALVLADLLTLPGRSDAEADQLMDALASNDPTWEE